MIIALGESIVAIGVGVDTAEVDAGIVVAAVLGTIVAAALWWLYFDVVALVAERRLSQAAPGRERNSIGRDSYGYLHLPMVAGIVLLALGLKKTLGHVEEPLKLVPAVALLGGTAMYLAAHVAFRLRNVHRFSVQRLLCALVLVALIPAAVELAALATLAILAALLVALIVYESIRFAELRDRLRHQVAEEHCGRLGRGARGDDPGRRRRLDAEAPGVLRQPVAQRGVDRRRAGAPRGRPRAAGSPRPGRWPSRTRSPRRGRARSGSGGRSDGRRCR